jgi:hypothetical protein
MSDRGRGGKAGVRCLVPWRWAAWATSSARSVAISFSRPATRSAYILFCSIGKRDQQRNSTPVVARTYLALSLLQSLRLLLQPRLEHVCALLQPLLGLPLLHRRRSARRRLHRHRHTLRRRTAGQRAPW